MAERSQHRESEGLEGRSERPAMGMGRPEPSESWEGTQVDNQYCPVRSRIAATVYDHTPPEKCGRFVKTACPLVFSQTH